MVDRARRAPVRRGLRCGSGRRHRRGRLTGSTVRRRGRAGPRRGTRGRRGGRVGPDRSDRSAGRHERRDRRARVGGGHDRLPHQHRIGALRDGPADVVGPVDPGLRHGERTLGQLGSQAPEGVRVELEGPQVARVDTDEGRPDAVTRRHLAGVVHLDERIEAGRQHRVVQPGEGRLVERRDDQQHPGGAGRACLPDLVWVDDEVLAQRRDTERRDVGEVGQRALEPVGLGEHGHGGSAAVDVGAGELRRVEVRGQVPPRR
jgi:hypothetical protein